MGRFLTKPRGIMGRFLTKPRGIWCLFRLAQCKRSSSLYVVEAFRRFSCILYDFTIYFRQNSLTLHPENTWYDFLVSSF